MKYYTFRHKNPDYSKYIIESTENYILVSFEDKDLPDIYQIFKREELENIQNISTNEEMLKNIIFDYVSQDNCYYQMNLLDGTSKKTGNYSLKKVFKQFENIEKESIRIKQNKEDIKSKFNNNTIQNQKSHFWGYKKYYYIDRDYCIKIPFRFKKSTRKGKQPLVIYMHGAGSIGSDNIKQLFEYLFLNTGLKSKDCHLLLPQCDVFENDNTKTLNVYTICIKKLLVQFSQNINIDFDRIYIIGSSFGGACVWYSIYNNPDFYAGAIPLMGYFIDVYSDNFKINNFKNTAIWLGHAENDNIVGVENDNFTYQKLKSAGVDIKFSKYQKYGHNLTKIFIHKEKWKKWLFNQKLTRR